MTRRLQDFLRQDLGAARTEAAFAVAALVVVVAMAVYLVMSGGPEERSPARLTPLDLALSELMEGEIRQFSQVQVRQRLETYFDPSDRTDSQLRNAHRTWAERSGDQGYRDPDLANDMFAIIDRAMIERGVIPHPGL